MNTLWLFLIANVRNNTPKTRHKVWGKVWKSMGQSMGRCMVRM